MVELTQEEAVALACYLEEIADEVTRVIPPVLISAMVKLERAKNG